MSDDSAKRGKLVGRRILVTGAASGIGRAIAHVFAAEGAGLALLDQDESGLRAVAEPLAALALPTELASPQEVDAAVANAVATYGGLDGVVNSAGIYKALSIEETTPEIWQRFLDVNLTGPFLVCRSALPHLRRQ